MDINTIIQAGSPNVSVSVSAADLMNVWRSIYAETHQPQNNANTLTEEETLLTRREAAMALHVGYTTLWRWERDSYLTPVKIGSKVYYRKSDIDSMLQKGVPA